MTTSRARSHVHRLGGITLLLVAWTLVSPGSASTAATGARTSKAVVAPTQEVVLVLKRHEAHARPSAASRSLGSVAATTPITGRRRVLPVLGTYRQWLLVRLPGRPNGHSGWISRRATTAGSTVWHLVLDTSSRKVTVYRSGHVLRVFPAVVGRPSTPTPIGEFFVEESLALSASDVGAPFALALSARSSVFQEFAGGPGQIAFHGLLNVGGVPGTAVSHGCVRLENAAMRWLAARVGAGVPVTIVN